MGEGLCCSLPAGGRRFTLSRLQWALPYLRQNQGNIINVSSLVGSIGQRDAVPYVATKVSGPPSTGGARDLFAPTGSF